MCYEGTNIIEVHVKHHGVEPLWNGGRSIIGIQNATGLSQTAGEAGSTNSQVVDGSPAAFFPKGYNNTSMALDSVAFRFTPQGSNEPWKSGENDYKWYRIFADGRDSVELPAYDQPGAEEDTNGFYYPMGHTTGRPTLTRAVARPGCESRYVMELTFLNAEGRKYVLRDTNTIGYVAEGDGVRETAAERANVYASDGQVVVEGVMEIPVTVYDAVGRVMQSAKGREGTTLRLDVPETGVYFVRVGNLPARRVVVVK